MQLEISLFTEAKENTNSRRKAADLFSVAVEKSMTINLEASLAAHSVSAHVLGGAG